MKFPKIYADESGETHFGVHETPDLDLALGPPPNPKGRMSDFGPVSSLRIFTFPAGTNAPAHPAPQPYVATGKGHVTRAITDLRLAFIQRQQT